MKIGLEWEPKPGRPIRVWFGWRQWRLFRKALSGLGDDTPHRILIAFRP